LHSFFVIDGNIYILLVFLMVIFCY